MMQAPSVHPPHNGLHGAAVTSPSAWRLELTHQHPGHSQYICPQSIQPFVKTCIPRAGVSTVDKVPGLGAILAWSLLPWGSHPIPPPLTYILDHIPASNREILRNTKIMTSHEPSKTSVPSVTKSFKCERNERLYNIGQWPGWVQSILMTAAWRKLLARETENRSGMTGLLVGWQIIDLLIDLFVHWSVFF